MEVLGAPAVYSTLAASAAYLNGKYHFSSDINLLSGFFRASTNAYIADYCKRASVWYDWEKQAHRFKNSQDIAIWSKGKCYTWWEGYQQSLRYSQYFLSLGVKPNDIVSLYMSNTSEFLLVSFGLWAIGAVPSYVNWNLNGENLLHCFTVAASALIIVDSEPDLQSRVDEVRPELGGEKNIQIVFLDQNVQQHIQSMPPIRPENKYRDHVTVSDMLCLIYTSGSSGFPKACRFQVIRLRLLFGLDSGQRSNRLKGRPSRWYVSMPLYHATGFVMALRSLMSGVTIAIGKKFSASRFWDEVRESDSTGIVYVGETARYLLAHKESPNDRNHRVDTMFGNGLRPDVWQAFQDRFGVKRVIEFFSSTEGLFNLLNFCNGPFQANSVGHNGLLLRMIFYFLYVPVKIDHDLNDIYRDPKTGWAVRMPYSEGGEIIVRIKDREKFSGYFKNEKATNQKIITDVFCKGDMYYRTGDSLRRNEDGLWFFLDRLGDTFRWKSENVSTMEVGSILGRYPGVMEANVYGVSVPGHEGRAGCAALYIPLLAPPSEALIEQMSRDEYPAGFSLPGLLSYCQSKMPKWAVPVFIRLVCKPTPMHNNKITKTPFRKQGIDLDLIRSGQVEKTGTAQRADNDDDEDVSDEKANTQLTNSPTDMMLWWPGGLSIEDPRTSGGRPNGYVEFRQQDLNAIQRRASMDMPAIQAKI